MEPGFGPAALSRPTNLPTSTRCGVSTRITLFRNASRLMWSASIRRSKSDGNLAIYMLTQWLTPLPIEHRSSRTKWHGTPSTVSGPPGHMHGNRFSYSIGSRTLVRGRPSGRSRCKVFVTSNYGYQRAFVNADSGNSPKSSNAGRRPSQILLGCHQ